MSKERALRRVERQRETAIKAAARAAADERRARKATRKARAARWLPQRRRTSSVLADRRRNELTVLFLILFTINLMLWLADAGWALRFLALIVSVLCAPVIFLMLFRRS